jgi:membrane protein
MNKAWHVQPDSSRGGLKNFVQKRILSFGMVMGIGFLLLASLVISAALSAFGEYIGGFFTSQAESFILQSVNQLISFAIITVMFAAMFKILPDAEIDWKDVWVGAAVTSLLFSIGKFAIGFYLGKSDVGSAYGAAGSLAIILVWLYYSAMIFFLGAEFTQAWARQYGKRIVPSPGAVRVETLQQEVSRGG